MPQKKIAPADEPPERLRKSIVDLTLANPGANELPVVLHADAAAAKKIGDGCNRFLGVLGARADGENQVAEGKFWTGFEDLFSFHGIELTKLEQM
jgi:hypothetical protein